MAEKKNNNALQPEIPGFSLYDSEDVCGTLRLLHPFQPDAVSGEIAACARTYVTQA